MNISGVMRRLPRDGEDACRPPLFQDAALPARLTGKAVALPDDEGGKCGDFQGGVGSKRSGSDSLELRNHGRAENPRAAVVMIFTVASETPQVAVDHGEVVVEGNRPHEHEVLLITEGIFEEEPVSRIETEAAEVVPGVERIEIAAPGVEIQAAGQGARGR